MRVILSIIAIASIVLGLLAIVGSCFAFQSEYMQHLSLDKAILIFGISFGVFMITSASLALYGIVHKKRVCIILFWVTLGLFLLVSTVFAIVLYFARQTYRSQYSQPNCELPSTHLHNLERAYLHANMLCTSKCPCNYKGLPPFDPKFVTYKDGAISAPECPNFDDSQYRFEAILMRGVEFRHKCAGICTTGTLPGFPNYYRFSDINQNKGKVTDGSCQQHVWPYLDSKLMVIIQTTLGLMLVSGIAFILATVLFIYGRRNQSPYWTLNQKYPDDEAPLIN